MHGPVSRDVPRGRARLAPAMRIAFLIALVAPAALAFQLTKAISEYGFADADHYVWVQDVPEGVRAATVVAAIERVAAREHIDVAKDVFDYRDPLEVRRLYVEAGGSAAEPWLANGAYPDFSADIRTVVHPLDELPEHSVRGFYNVYGSESGARALLAELEALGIGGMSAPHPALIESVIDDTIASAITVGLLALAILIAFAVLADAKRYGVQRLHGRSIRGALADDIIAAARYVAPRAAVTIGVILAGLFIYNGWEQLDQYFLTATVFWAAGFATVAVAHFVAFGLVHRSSIMDALKGEFASGPSLIAAYLARIASVAIAVNILFGTIATGSALAERSRAADTMHAVGDSVYLMIDGSVVDGREALDERLARMVQSAEARGDVVVGATQPIAALDGDQLDLHDLLVVNQAYLDRYPLVVEDGTRIASSTDAPVIVLPQARSAEEATLRAAVSDWTSMVWAGAPMGDGIEVHLLAKGERAAAFGYFKDLHSEVERTDPIVLVLPQNGAPLATHMWSAWTTTGDVFFTSPGAASAAIAAAELNHYVVALNPVAQNAATELRRLGEEQRMNLMSTAIATGVVVMTGFAISLIYARRHAQAIFVKHTHGVSFVRSHLWIIATELSLVVAIGTWWSVRSLHAHAEFHSTGPRTAPPQEMALDGREPLIAALAMTVSLIVMLATIAGFSRRNIRSQSSHV